MRHRRTRGQWPRRERRNHSAKIERPDVALSPGASKLAQVHRSLVQRLPSAGWAADSRSHWRRVARRDPQGCATLLDARRTVHRPVLGGANGIGDSRCAGILANVASRQHSTAPHSPPCAWRPVFVRSVARGAVPSHAASVGSRHSPNGRNVDRAWPRRGVTLDQGSRAAR
jgi:hypothetical protein